VGFDDFDWMLALRPTLTTVAQPVDDFAASAWRLLMRRIGGEADAQAQNILLPCALRVRESTGPARPWLTAVAKVR
ncbi:MAG: substrate-binding domain-containing protein, partial [Caulobacteraceae bacterium]|nr:substrate-binding domain-containing protein [Caulobacteraceae bacterium]